MKLWRVQQHHHDQYTTFLAFNCMNISLYSRLHGIHSSSEETGDSMWTPPTQQLDTCLAYLRDRVGVPRDMGPVAAMQLRAHLNWAISLMK
jgi:hypothetical protein